MPPLSIGLILGLIIGFAVGTAVDAIMRAYYKRKRERESVTVDVPEWGSKVKVELKKVNFHVDDTIRKELQKFKNEAYKKMTLHHSTSWQPEEAKVKNIEDLLEYMDKDLAERVKNQKGM